MNILHFCDKGRTKKAFFKCEVLRLISDDIRFHDPLGHVLSSLDGVSRADVNYTEGKVFTEFDPRIVSVGDIINAINSMGYGITNPESVAVNLKMQTNGKAKRVVEIQNQ